MEIGDVIQFNEKHKWCGCLEFITELKKIHNDKIDSEGTNDIRYMVCVPTPEQGGAYIYGLLSDDDIEYIGKAPLMPKGSDEDE